MENAEVLKSPVLLPVPGDDHGYAQTLLDKTDLLTVNRITHTGNCVAVTSLLGDQTAQKVHLI